MAERDFSYFFVLLEILGELEISLNIAIKQPVGLEVKKFFPRETELEKLRNAREFKIKDFEFGKNVSRKKRVSEAKTFFCLICCSQTRRARAETESFLVSLKFHFRVGEEDGCFRRPNNQRKKPALFVSFF